ncbi:MAG: hypothetical protein FWF97_03565 [Alphaproteobacteria bacterium]|nr:hypothetical protein [Alphaproteobacteria bacterium]
MNKEKFAAAAAEVKNEERDKIIRDYESAIDNIRFRAKNLKEYTDSKRPIDAERKIEMGKEIQKILELAADATEYKKQQARSQVLLGIQEIEI